MIDNGKGIRREDMKKLFQQFGKLKRTAEMNSEGIGMGLMICQNLINSCGGAITVHSDGEDRGAVFKFTMKMEKSNKQIGELQNDHDVELTLLEDMSSIGDVSPRRQEEEDKFENESSASTLRNINDNLLEDSLCRPIFDKMSVAQDKVVTKVAGRKEESAVTNSLVPNVNKNTVSEGYDIS